MESYKARGVVLHTVKYGESSVIVYMLTDVFGRQSYMVQGIRDRGGRGNKGALFQPMFLLEFEGKLPRNGELHRLGDIRTSIPLCSIPFDPRKSTISLFMAELLYKVVREVEPHSPLFDFVHSSVEALDLMEEGVANFHLWFLTGLSRLMGFCPGNEYTEGAWLDIPEGLFTRVKPTHNHLLSAENTRLLDRLSTLRPDALAELRLSRSQRVEYISGVVNFLGYHLDSIHKVESLRILHDVF